MLMLKGGGKQEEKGFFFVKERRNEVNEYPSPYIKEED